MCLPGKEFHLQCNLHFYKYSMSKGHERVKNQGGVFQQESWQNPGPISTLGPNLEARSWGPHWPLPHTVQAAGGQGLPPPEPPGKLLPGLLTFSDQRQGGQARIGMRRLSAFSEFQVCLRRECACVCVYTLMCTYGGEGQIWRLNFAGHFN